MRGLCASFQAKACSRPPPPTTINFIVQYSSSVPEVAHAGEEHGDAAFVGGGDHLRIAHAATGLDHRRGALDLELRFLRLHRRHAHAVEPAHLAGADADARAVAAEHDCIGLDEL